MGASDHHPHGREEGCAEGDSQEGIPNRRRSSAQSKGGAARDPGTVRDPRGLWETREDCGDPRGYERPGGLWETREDCERPQGL